MYIDGLFTLKVRGEDGKPDLLITMDKTKLRSVAAPAIANFLRKLQVILNFELNKYCFMIRNIAGNLKLYT